jgi:hypothetical protein
MREGEKVFEGGCGLGDLKFNFLMSKNFFWTFLNILHFFNLKF